MCSYRRISGAVLQVLLPFLDAIKDDLSSVKRDSDNKTNRIGLDILPCLLL